MFFIQGSVMNLKEMHAKRTENIGHEKVAINEQDYQTYRVEFQRDIDKFIEAERIRKTKTAEESRQLTLC